MQHVNWYNLQITFGQKWSQIFIPSVESRCKPILSGCSKYTHIGIRTLKYDQYTGNTWISHCVSLNLKYEFIMRSVTLFDASKAYYVRVDNY